MTVRIKYNTDRSPIFEKICPGPKLGKMGLKWPKSRVLGHFLDFESYHIFLILYILIDSNDIYQELVFIYCTKKNNWVQIGPILNLSPNYFASKFIFLRLSDTFLLIGMISNR